MIGRLVAQNQRDGILGIANVNVDRKYVREAQVWQDLKRWDPEGHNLLLGLFELGERASR